MRMKLEELIEGHRDSITVKRVFGEPYQKNGVTVIPAAKVIGGGGGSEGDLGEGETAGKGLGTGFGLAARPVGAYIIRGDDVKWRPAVDLNRVIAGIFALIALAFLLKSRREGRLRD